MNSWICSELEKIDIKTIYIIKEFEKIKQDLFHSPNLYNIVYKPTLDKLINYDYKTEMSIHDIQQICQNVINNYIENKHEIEVCDNCGKENCYSNIDCLAN